MPAPYHPPVKRSVEIAGHKTSISLEPLFWDMLRGAAARKGLPVNTLVAQIDEERIASATPCGLAGAIRLWLVSIEGSAEGKSENSTDAEGREDPAPQPEQQ
jgi:predicted DNA-binding ribbon-helix-helix protein